MMTQSWHLRKKKQNQYNIVQSQRKDKLKRHAYFFSALTLFLLIYMYISGDFMTPTEHKENWFCHWKYIYLIGRFSMGYFYESRRILGSLQGESKYRRQVKISQDTKH